MLRPYLTTCGRPGPAAPRPVSPDDRPDHQEGLVARGDLLRQWRVRRVVRQIPRAREEAQERPALRRDMVANRPAQHRIPCLECVEYRRARERMAADIERDLAADLRQRLQVRPQHDADHGSACASTDNTAGRSRTMGAQLSPPSVDPYTWPPVVPKYTPHGCSESTDIASRRTFT